ncbi:hypothetical protein AZL_020160 [Azospirillum sp. B510]|nr:hypothetical protein AZL_008630 [Azospirillum sp. B510]BAI72654.1 hypothetical protein AZL_020160 [Azospirillum sp. B510]
MLPLPEGLTPEDVTALQSVAAEVARQRKAEQFCASHDDHHIDGSLAAAGGCYLLHAGATKEGRDLYPVGTPCNLWPWADPWWKPRTPQRDAVRGAALGVAEISRRLRAGEKVEG